MSDNLVTYFVSLFFVLVSAIEAFNLGGWHAFFAVYLFGASIAFATCFRK